MILSRLKTAVNGPNWECERLKNCKLRVRRSAPKLLITCYSSALSITTTTTALPHNSLRVTRFNMLGQVVNQQANFLFQKLPATAVVFEAGGVVDDAAIGWKLPVTVSFRPCKKIPFVHDVFFCWLKIDQVQSKCTISCRESSFMMLPKVRFFELEIWCERSMPANSFEGIFWEVLGRIKCSRKNWIWQTWIPWVPGSCNWRKRLKACLLTVALLFRSLCVILRSLLSRHGMPPPCTILLYVRPLIWLELLPLHGLTLKDVPTWILLTWKWNALTKKALSRILMM